MLAPSIGHTVHVIVLILYCDDSHTRVALYGDGPYVHLVLIGVDGPQQPQHTQRLASAGVSKNTKFITDNLNWNIATLHLISDLQMELNAAH